MDETSPEKTADDDSFASVFRGHEASSKFFFSAVPHQAAFFGFFSMPPSVFGVNFFISHAQPSVSPSDLEWGVIGSLVLAIKAHSPAPHKHILPFSYWVLVVAESPPTHASLPQHVAREVTFSFAFCLFLVRCR